MTCTHPSLPRDHHGTCPDCGDWVSRVTVPSCCALWQEVPTGMAEITTVNSNQPRPRQPNRHERRAAEKRGRMRK